MFFGYKRLRGYDIGKLYLHGHRVSDIAEVYGVKESRVVRELAKLEAVGAIPDVDTVCDLWVDSVRYRDTDSDSLEASRVYRTRLRKLLYELDEYFRK